MLRQWLACAGKRATLSVPVVAGNMLSVVSRLDSSPPVRDADSGEVVVIDTAAPGYPATTPSASACSISPA